MSKYNGHGYVENSIYTHAMNEAKTQGSVVVAVRVEGVILREVFGIARHGYKEALRLAREKRTELKQKRIRASRAEYVLVRTRTEPIEPKPHLVEAAKQQVNQAINNYMGAR